MPWLENEKSNAEEAYRKIEQRFTDLANDFLLKVRSLGSTVTGDSLKELIAAQDFRTRSAFQFYDFVYLAMPASPVRFVADLLLGAVRSHFLIDADAREFLDRLLETNSERVRNDLETRVAESRCELEAEIRSMLRQLSAVAEHALSSARSAHAAGAEGVESSLRRLATAEAELARLAEAQLPDLAQR